MRVKRDKRNVLSDEVRQQIVFETLVMGEPLKRVCQVLKVNYLSGKTVVQVFKKSNRVEKLIGNEAPLGEQIQHALTPIIMEIDERVKS